MGPHLNLSDIRKLIFYLLEFLVHSFGEVSRQKLVLVIVENMMHLKAIPSKNDQQITTWWLVDLLREFHQSHVIWIQILNILIQWHTQNLFVINEIEQNLPAFTVSSVWHVQASIQGNVAVYVVLGHILGKIPLSLLLGRDIRRSIIVLLYQSQVFLILWLDLVWRKHHIYFYCVFFSKKLID